MLNFFKLGFQAKVFVTFFQVLFVSSCTCISLENYKKKKRVNSLGCDFFDLFRKKVQHSFVLKVINIPRVRLDEISIS
jgi:hypothetical protein